MSAHKFESTVTRGKCDVCGKTRNAKAHSVAAIAAAIELSKPGPSSGAKVRSLQDEAPAETYGVTEEKAPPQSSRYRKPADQPVSGKLWVGWRIANAVVLLEDPAARTLVAKIHEAKPNSELDRFVQLTTDEIDQLDAVAQVYEQPGNKGPIVYSARSLRRRLAEAKKELTQ